MACKTSLLAFGRQHVLASSAASALMQAAPSRDTGTRKSCAIRAGAIPEKHLQVVKAEKLV